MKRSGPRSHPWYLDAVRVASLASIGLSTRSNQKLMSLQDRPRVDGLGMRLPLITRFEKDGPRNTAASREFNDEHDSSHAPACEFFPVPLLTSTDEYYHHGELNVRRTSLQLQLGTPQLQFRLAPVVVKQYRTTRVILELVVASPATVSSSSEPPESSSSAPSSSSEEPSSSSSSSTSSDPGPSSSSTKPSPSPTLTQPPPTSVPPSTAAPESSTESHTTYTTLIDGELTTVVGPAPTALSPSPTSNPAFNKRTAAIAGATIAGVFLLLLILATTFLLRRHRRKLKERFQTILHPRRRTREDRGLLDGEDFFDEDEDHMIAMRAYRDVIATPLPSTGTHSRATTPGGMAEVRQREADGDVNLSRIVDDVMGPPTGTHAAEASASTSASTPMPMQPAPPDSTSNSDPDRLGNTPSSMYNDPFRSVSPSLSAAHNHDGSVYYALPPPPPPPPAQSSSSSSPLPPGAAPPKRLAYRSGTAGVGAKK
ncbi:hypothetical protein D9615_007077 [Tricholomella constricta]|uniref:Uncharacterized protein n=1 Tax=Tricholomella constricta TaxID=117010 RepID=A0A8H5M268_9AGAR|nr:hypothetical protein D9615_007077 [Tricholomella constricta]